MKTNPLRLPFYIYIYLYMYTQTSADINRMLKPQKKLKNLLLYYQKQEFFKKYKVVSEKFSDHWKIRWIASKPTKLKGRAGIAYTHCKQFLTWVAAQDTCGVTNWPPIEGLPNPDFKHKLYPFKIDTKVAGVPRLKD